MRIARTVEHLTDALLQFIRTQHALWFNDPSFPVSPFWLDRIEPISVKNLDIQSVSTRYRLIR